MIKIKFSKATKAYQTKDKPTLSLKQNKINNKQTKPPFIKDTEIQWTKWREFLKVRTH